MSYITVEVQIERGRIIPSEPDKLPQNGTALLTILNSNETVREFPSTGITASPMFDSTVSLQEITPLNADTWEKLGPAPDIDYDKL